MLKNIILSTTKEVLTGKESLQIDEIWGGEGVPLT